METEHRGPRGHMPERHDDERERIIFTPEQVEDAERLAEASQEISKGIPSPFLSIPKDTERLIPRQEAILWANQRLERYTNFIPGTSNRKTRFLRDSSIQLVQRVRNLDVIAETWSKESVNAQPTNKRTPTFLEELTPFLRSEAQKEWRDMGHEQLADLVKSLTYSDDGRPIAKIILQGYFEGPIHESVRGSKDVVNAARRRNVVSAYSRFVEAGLDLVDYPEALKKAILIDYYREDEILPRKSDFYRHLTIASNIAFDDEKMFQAALVTDRIFAALASLASVSFEDEIRLQEDFFLRDEVFSSMRRDEAERLIAKYGYQPVVEKIEAIKEMHAKSSARSFRSGQELEAYRSKWPLNLIYDRSIPLNERFEKEVHSQIIAYQTKRDVVDPSYERAGLGKSVIVSLPREDSSIIDIYVPESLIGRRVEIINQFLHLDTSDQTRPQDDFFAELTWARQQFEGVDINYSLRFASELEGRQHPITRLEPVGFPTPAVEEGMSVRELNQQKARAILRLQMRYPTSRRIRVPLEHEQLQALGYNNVYFSRIRDTNSLRVDVDFLGQNYPIVLDDNLEFDLEGRAFRNQDFRETVRFTLLSILDPVLTTEPEELEDPIEQGPSKRIISRIGHMRRLKEGWSYSQKAINNFLEYEQGNLPVKNRELQAEKQTERNFTYVRPIISEMDEELPAVTYHVPPESLRYVTE